ncbi:protein-tyrosine phosphatase-like protein [Tribonema minus]|uniref:very-long-chain (3R)-3-hydroxyacyl-CoA dehydratase n=1 Tax=Tribonema minus TaxID=303371 RepID=A0A835Z8Y0_9STRA|nr:protein-tyrosine phosphatase-like protein [Tribonema minus]
MLRSYWQTQQISHSVENATPLVVGLQLLSTLELVHVLLGLTRGGAAQTFAQIGGRDICLFLTAAAEPAVRRSWVAALLYATWAASEIIRYPYYATNLLEICPDFLHWLRYSAFMLLYPLGFAAEVGCFVVAYPHMKAGDKYRIEGLPEGGQFAVLGAYMLFAHAIGALTLFKYMLKARKRQLRQPAVTGTFTAKEE